MCFPISAFPLLFLLPSLQGDQSYLLFSPHYGQKVVSLKYSNIASATQTQKMIPGLIAFINSGMNDLGLILISGVQEIL